MGITVSNIQRMSTQDGPGMRTVVFLKGCTLRCPWCSNPENINPQKQYWYRREICDAHYGSSDKCDSCDKSFVLSRICRHPYESCPFGAIGVYGKEYCANALVRELLKDFTYWKHSGGGVTFSGGEPLLQAMELKPVLQRLKHHKIHVAVETSLHVPIACIENTITEIDHYMIDLKILDFIKCANKLKGNMNLFFENIHYLAVMDKNIIFRMVANKDILEESNLEIVSNLLSKYPKPIEILTMHNFGETKYRSLGLKPPLKHTSNYKSLDNFMLKIAKCGVEAKIKFI
jgi:pyruvate formate lyase activating enzyme